MAARERKRATAPVYKSDGRVSGVRATVPLVVREHLGATVGDTLVFEEGCAAAVDRAALRGPYFVVTVERAPVQIEPREHKAPDESFADSVRKFVERKDEERVLNS